MQSLFRDKHVESKWLREKKTDLEVQEGCVINVRDTPLENLVEGPIENLMLVKEYIEAYANG